MKRLIVNADDFNSDVWRSRGILQAVRSGIVSSVSVLTSPGLNDEARLALGSVAAAGAGIGVHLNLTKGRPLRPDVSSLSMPGGRFFSKPAAWQRALRRGYDQAEAEQEFAAQVEALLVAGYQPDHIDGNNHVHVFPVLAAAAISVACRFGIRRIRLPREPLFWSLRRPGRAVLKKFFISLLCLRAEKLFRQAGLIFPDRCAGLHVPDPAAEKALVDFLAGLPCGTTELMCHPGYAGGESPYSTRDRERELAGLTSAGVLAAVAHNQISLISFGDLPCA